MSEPVPDRQAREPRRPEAERVHRTGPPRWAVALGIAAAVAVAVALVVLHLTGSVGSGAH
jgi:hypothetical protein